ncbi:AAA family ATPase [Mordavella massiliensis]|uniref:Cytidylate kinase-like family protein n=1 Tax=Mordavella massiliensis TaxID=1871024 RepID=A0A939BCF9_9CLOT|nr:cytidylate kinase-like family protein [Mordavella massiliensis]MBM6826722.1 cytidylate kinase-like family protein [Mordavella massiliensis]HJB86508.1 cytidylate kinase-like family protein [Candidatus Dorea faecigallinarum]
MTEHRIITIGREFGSGGHEIGNLLATRLDIPLYDNNLIRMVAEKLDIREETARAVDETTLNSFLAGFIFEPIEESSRLNGTEYVPPLTQQVYELQCDIIRKLAERGPCIIVGRCADFVLRDHKNCINVFICADWEDRVERIAAKYDISQRKAADKIKKMDRERRNYYESHTGQEWGSIDSHHMLLNVSRLGMDRTVDILERICR